MKRMKKLFAILITMAMVMGLGITGFAAGLVIPDDPAKTATATVEGVTEEGATVTAYQLVSYDDKKQDYVVATAAKNLGYTVGSNNPEIVSTIAADNDTLDALPSTALNKEGDVYSKELPAGTYLILVTNTGATIYNPMLVSLEVTYPDGIQPGNVNADTNYVVGDDTIAYAKSTDDVPVDKNIVDENGDTIGKHDDVFADQTVYFELSGTIPSYSKQYVNAVYTINDELSKGLTINASAVKTDIEEQLAEDGITTDDVTVTVENNKITIAFDSEYILENGLKEIKVTYAATVNGEEFNFDPATNKVYPTYSNNPGDTVDGTPKETKHYTFDLKQELVKKDDAGTLLEGAEFELTKDGKKVAGTSVKDGWIQFKGLDAGTYTLTETKAPDGYQLSGKKYTVIISAEYNEDDTLKSYTVTTKDGDDVIGEITYTADNTYTGTAADILNTKLTDLPSTGGMGTTIFTIAGCVIMISAAGLFFASRRKVN